MPDWNKILHENTGKYTYGRTFNYKSMGEDTTLHIGALLLGRTLLFT